MSATTLQAVHDAIAAHIEDENDDDPEYLTEWALVASTAISTNPDAAGYYYYGSPAPLHHAVGLLHHGLQYLNSPQEN